MLTFGFSGDEHNDKRYSMLSTRGHGTLSGRTAFYIIEESCSCPWRSSRSTKNAFLFFFSCLVPRHLYRCCYCCARRQRRHPKKLILFGSVTQCGVNPLLRTETPRLGHRYDVPRSTSLFSVGHSPCLLTSIAAKCEMNSSTFMPVRAYVSIALLRGLLQSSSFFSSASRA